METERWIEKLREVLQQERLSRGAIRIYTKAARCFLNELCVRGIRPENVTPLEVTLHLRRERLRYRRRRGRFPIDHRHWRCHYTPGIHALLRLAQGCWPPPSPFDQQIAHFAKDLANRGLQAKRVRDYCGHVRLFLEDLESQKLRVSEVQPSDVDEYFHAALRTYRKRWQSFPTSRRNWRNMTKWAVHAYLRFARGEWPPDSAPPPVLLRFRASLEESGYCVEAVACHVSSFRRLLAYLRKRNIALEGVVPSVVADFVDENLRDYRTHRGRLPADPAIWKTRLAGRTHRALRFCRPDWPPSALPADAGEEFRCELLESYRRWLTEDHGLSTRTADKNGHNVRSWLDWLGDRAHRKSLSNLSVADIDAYLALRLPGLRRATRGGVCQGLRSFLRYLHTSGLIGQDLSHVVRGPILYKFDEIPRAFTEEQVKSLLEAARGDLRPVGLRDYAALILLAKYGLRGGEVTRLCLDDIDWRGERIRIRHSKSGKESFLPLLAPVGETLLQYLRFGRPRTTDREIFVRSRAPHQPFSSASALGSMIGRRLARLGIDVKGRHGTHAFRFARALSLLRASVPLKTIGDLLGHRTTSSTQAYLRLPTNELRAISLELPKKGVR